MMNDKFRNIPFKNDVEYIPFNELEKYASGYYSYKERVQRLINELNLDVDLNSL